jgi:hypothetical protein
MRIGKLAVLAVGLTAAATMLLGTGAASARAGPAAQVHGTTTRLPASSDGPCDQYRPDVCIYQGNYYTGNADIIPTSQHGYWISITSSGIISLPWHSFHDFSGSSVVFGDAQSGAEVCYFAGGSLPGVGPVGYYRYVDIEYGDPMCNGSPPPLP